MSGVSVHTIPGPKPEAYGHDVRSIVGVSLPGSGELWVPSRTIGPAYPEYDPLDTVERELPLDADQADRLITFFEERVLPNLDTMQFVPGKWDCHSFALWMRDLIPDPEAIDLDETEAAQDANIRAGRKIDPQKLKLGEIGIIGGRTREIAAARHSVVGLEKNRGLQVLGTHGPVAIANHERVLRSYRTAWRGGKFSSKQYGMYAAK